MFLSCSKHGTKKKFWVLICCTAEQGLSLISYAKHDTNDIDDSNSIQEVCYIWVSWWALLTIEPPLLLSDRASECGIWMSEVWFLLGLRSFLLSHACDKTKKTSFSMGTLNSKISFPVFLCEFKCNLHKQLMFFSLLKPLSTDGKHNICVKVWRGFWSGGFKYKMSVSKTVFIESFHFHFDEHLHFTFSNFYFSVFSGKSSASSGKSADDGGNL